MMRTHYCGLVTENLNDQTITICGWVHRRRDHGGVIFLDMRDREGLLQVVIDPDTPEAFATADSARSEYVLKITGRVRQRYAGTENKNMTSGQVELLAKDIETIATSETPPFPLNDEFTNVSEELRLKYRFLDMRRPEMQERMKFRAKATSTIRRYLDDQGFLDVETPILTRATPEGARDYLVPSRVSNGEFYALPQSPQLFKQLLMVAGFDRYYQIAKCFRDEDLRADRQPEFTQIDIETSFLSDEDIMNIAEGLTKDLFKTMMNIEFDTFPRMTYAEAMRDYASDKPDLRIPMKLIDVADIMQSVEFKVFSAPAQDPKGRVVALRVPNGSDLTRKQIDEYTKFVGIYGAKGLAYIKVNDVSNINNGVDKESGLQSPIIKNMTDEVLVELIKRTEAQTGDIIFFGADKAKVVNDAIGALRDATGSTAASVQSRRRPTARPTRARRSPGARARNTRPDRRPRCAARAARAAGRPTAPETTRASTGRSAGHGASASSGCRPRSASRRRACAATSEPYEWASTAPCTAVPRARRAGATSSSSPGPWRRNSHQARTSAASIAPPRRPGPSSTTRQGVGAG